MNLLEQFGMKDCNPAMMPYVSRFDLNRSTAKNYSTHIYLALDVYCIWFTEFVLILC
jgi:hypothetical protein